LKCCISDEIFLSVSSLVLQVKKYAAVVKFTENHYAFCVVKTDLPALDCLVTQTEELEGF
jgi:hypothetical protein